MRSPAPAHRLHLLRLVALLGAGWAGGLAAAQTAVTSAAQASAPSGSPCMSLAAGGMTINASPRCTVQFQDNPELRRALRNGLLGAVDDSRKRVTAVAANPARAGDLRPGSAPTAPMATGASQAASESRRSARPAKHPGSGQALHELIDRSTWAKHGPARPEGLWLTPGPK